MRHAMLVLPVLALAIAAGGCQSAVQPPAKPVAGFVTDRQSFDAFIATHPTPEQFRARYPDVQLILPGMVATMEFRSNNSRYFPELDQSGRITGGHFG
jgi:hypothetical protein